MVRIKCQQKLYFCKILVVFQFPLNIFNHFYLSKGSNGRLDGKKSNQYWQKIILGMLFLNQVVFSTTLLLLPYIIQEIIENTGISSSLNGLNTSLISLISTLTSLNDTLASLNMDGK